MALEVTVHTKDACGECVKTKNALNLRQVPHQTIHVADDQVEKIEQLRDIAEQMGVGATMPFVQVIDTTTGEAEQWFGHRPDKIVEHITTKRSRKQS
ncbi:glutaredoxin family protein [Arthrobacter sp. JUb115]|uniref:glutaredoxin family protein n=1 Tax=Arthrobacter sp. JUb115 TaxID=2485108 RepID=UPI00105F2711|nr:glutaredoxin family protein [Arthrobacter sp. JUb115]TDU27075.1 glutaredoxin [Arthrobacter sp. JUb115]